MARLESGIVAAFEEAHDGYSADRVVVDRSLNERFLEACRDSRLPGSQRDWNLLLFRLRKVGRLAHIPTSKRTAIPWDECDPYLYASEIAWQMLLDSGRAGSLDEILCDPVLAAEFDDIARGFAPEFESLCYRWGALKLRKQAKLACTRRSEVGRPQFRKADRARLEDYAAADAPRGPGVYIICDKTGRRVLYVGESLNLRDRLSRQFTRSLCETWKAEAERRRFGEPHIRTARSSPTLGMLAWQSYFVTRYRRPPLNLRDLQATS